MSAVRWTRWRRASQASAALGFLALPFLGEPWLAGTPIALRVGPLELAEPAAALSVLLAAAAIPLRYALGALVMIGVAVALGPVACSWLCPWGLVSEGLDRLRARGAPWPARAWLAARRPRLVALGALLGLSAVTGVPLAAALAPPRLVAALPLEAWRGGVVPWVTGALLLALLGVELLGPRRLVCRALCPAGAAAALVRRSFTWGPRFTAAACHCAEQPACQQACAWGIDPRAMTLRDGCTSCMACLERCPTGALAAPRRHSPHRGN